MIIDGFQKLTLLDYPSHMACLIFTRGCNLNCPFCQNSPLIDKDTSPGFIQEEEVFSYLEKRRNLLEGIVISGGEPLMQKDLIPFLRKVKDLGYLVKLDTNGSFPNLLKDIIKENLVDYVAMDIKNVKDDYAKIVGLKSILFDPFQKSIELLKKSKIAHEFRTTLIKEFHDLSKVRAIATLIGKDEKYYLQNFADSENVLDKSLHGFSKDELQFFEKSLREDFPKIELRGL